MLRGKLRSHPPSCSSERGPATWGRHKKCCPKQSWKKKWPVRGAASVPVQKRERRQHWHSGESRTAGKDTADIAVAAKTRRGGNGNAYTAALAPSPENRVVEHGRGPSTAGKHEEQGNENTAPVAAIPVPPLSDPLTEKANPGAESPEKPVEKAAAVAAIPEKPVVKQEQPRSPRGTHDDQQKENSVYR